MKCSGSHLLTLSKGNLGAALACAVAPASPVSGERLTSSAWPADPTGERRRTPHQAGTELLRAEVASQFMFCSFF